MLMVLSLIRRILLFLWAVLRRMFIVCTFLSLYLQLLRWIVGPCRINCHFLITDTILLIFFMLVCISQLLSHVNSFIHWELRINWILNIVHARVNLWLLLIKTLSRMIPLHYFTNLILLSTMTRHWSIFFISF